MLAFRDAYGALVRAQLAEMLKKRDKAKERRLDKLLVASRKKLEEQGGRVLIRGASAYRFTHSRARCRSPAAHARACAREKVARAALCPSGPVARRAQRRP